MEFAVIQTGGKQYIVKPGDVVQIEKLIVSDKELMEGDKVTFSEVLLVDDGDSTTTGAPFIDGASVAGVIVEKGREKKVITQKYKAKVRYRNKKGHRQPFMKVRIESIK